MKTKLVYGLAALAGLSAANCSKKKSSSTDPTTTTAAGTTSTSGSAGSVTTIANLSLVPDVDTFLKSSSTSASLTNQLALHNRGDGYSLITGTPPNFTDIAASLETYLTGNVSTIATAIKTQSTAAPGGDEIQAQLKKFFDAEAKCAVIEHSAHIIQRMRQDTAPVCLLKAVGPIGDKVYKYKSGTEIPDLTKIFVPTAEDKVLQLGLTDKDQPHYEVVQITGTTNNPNGYHVVYSTCLSKTKKAFRQNVLDIDNGSGVMTFKSYNNGMLDDKGAKPSASFALSGYVVADGAGGAQPDTSKARTVSYAGTGSFGRLTSTEQGTLTLSANEMAAVFFASETGTDTSSNTSTRTDKTAMDVQYTGTGTSDLKIYQGAGRSILTMTGSFNGATVTNSNDHSIGFSFDDTATPQYITATSSTYINNVASVDFAADAILKQTEPTGPDLTKIDDTACTATPTTVLNYIDRPEDNTTYAAALAACNTLPAEKSANMCDPLRDKEHDINDGLKKARAAAPAKNNF